MRLKHLISAVSLLVAAVSLAGPYAHAQVTCIQTYVATSDARTLGFAPSDVEELVSRIAGSIGLSPQGIKIIPCASVGKVQSIYYNQDSIPKGDYILYDPTWVREVIGPSLEGNTPSAPRDEAIFLFGHELGHLLGRHFTSNSELPRFEKETQADRFGGCAAGRLNADWQNIQAFIDRIRGDTDTTYPSRQHSREVARASFEQCRVSIPASVAPRYKIVSLGPEFIPPKMNGRTLDGCLISPEHPSGDDCSVQARQTIAAQFCKQAGFLTSATFEELFTPTFKASYKLTRKVLSSGDIDYVWNEDDTGGDILTRVLCRN